MRFVLIRRGAEEAGFGLFFVCHFLTICFSLHLGSNLWVVVATRWRTSVLFPFFKEGFATMLDRGSSLFNLSFSR